MPIKTCSVETCEMWISISVIEGGNPTAKSNPEHFAQAYLYCSDMDSCGTVYCKSCVDNRQIEACGRCGGEIVPGGTDHARRLMGL